MNNIQESRPKVADHPKKSKFYMQAILTAESVQKIKTKKIGRHSKAVGNKTAKDYN